MYKLIFYVPKDKAQKVKEAIFETGAGRIGNYSHCAWETLGRGQFKPLSGANPAIGSVGAVEFVEELRVEVLCLKDQVRSAVSAMKSAHPYEEVAYEIISVRNHEFE